MRSSGLAESSTFEISMAYSVPSIVAMKAVEPSTVTPLNELASRGIRHFVIEEESAAESIAYR